MRRGRQIVQVRDRVKCEKGAEGDNRIRKRCESMRWWVKWWIEEMVLSLEDNRGEKKFTGGCCSVYACSFFYSCGILSPCVCINKTDKSRNERHSTKHSYLCNLSSSSSIYLVVFSFSRLSVRRKKHNEKTAYYFHSFINFINRYGVS